MQKKITNNFLKELIDYDFAIAKSTIKKNNLNNVSSRLNLKNKEQYNVLDIFKLNQSLKQFIRILYFLQSAKKRKYQYLFRGRIKTSSYRMCPNLIIYIWSTNKFILELIDLYITKNNLKEYIVTTEVCPVSTTLQDRNKKKFLFILGSPWELTPERTLHEKILYNKFYLVNTLDFNAEKSEFNTYKIQNDLADYKKLMVLLVIIERVLSLHPDICEIKSDRILKSSKKKAKKSFKNKSKKKI